MARATLLLSTLLFGLSGCGSLVKFGPEGPPPSLYRLETATPAAAPEASTTPRGVLLVALPDAAAELRGDRILVRSTARQIAYLGGARWADRPALMTMGLIEEALHAQGAFRILGPRQIDIPADYRLDSALDRFEIDASGPAPVARATLDLSLSVLKPIRLVGTRRFTAEVRADSESIASMIKAFNLAASQIAADAAPWITQTASGQ